MLFPQIEDKILIKLFNHLPTISVYNWNYYEYQGELLLGISDDDGTTDWYISKYRRFHFLGQSYIDISGKDDSLHRMEKQPT